MSQTQEWIKEKYSKENSNVYYNNMKLTKEIEELKQRVKKLEEDMAYKFNSMKK